MARGDRIMLLLLLAGSPTGEAAPEPELLDVAITLALNSNVAIARQLVTAITTTIKTRTP